MTHEPIAQPLPLDDTLRRVTDHMAKRQAVQQYMAETSCPDDYEQHRNTDFAQYRRERLAALTDWFEQNHKSGVVAQRIPAPLSYSAWRQSQATFSDRSADSRSALSVARTTNATYYSPIVTITTDTEPQADTSEAPAYHDEDSLTGKAGSGQKLPKLAEMLFFCVPARLRDSLLGDLAEEYCEMCRCGELRQARLWLAGNVLASLWCLWKERLNVFTLLADWWRRISG